MSADRHRRGPSAGDSSDSAAVVAVRVKPRARQTGIVGRHAGGIKVAVHAAPERGRANDELVAVLAMALGVDRAAVEIVAGTTSQDKKVRVHGLDAAELRRRLDALLGTTPE